MSRDAGERRLGRRRLFVYRPSDFLERPSIQSVRRSPRKSDPPREQQPTSQWLPPTPRLWEQEGREELPRTPIRGGAAVDQWELPSLSTPPKSCASPSKPRLRASPLEKNANRILSVELNDVTHQVPPRLMKPWSEGRPPDDEDTAASASRGWEGSRALQPADGSRAPYAEEGSRDLYTIDGSIAPYLAECSRASYPAEGSIDLNPADGSRAPYLEDGSRAPYLEDGSRAPYPAGGSTDRNPADGSRALYLEDDSGDLHPESRHCADVTAPPTDAPSDLLPSRPQSPSAKIPRWGLVPFFHSMRSKLESFAEIFLSPVKTRQDSQQPLHSPVHSQLMAEQQDDSPDLEASTSAGPHAENPTDSAPCTPPRDPHMNLQLKIEFCSPASSSPLCRPPLQRCLSCPALPPRPARRHSLEVVEHSEVVACSCRALVPSRRQRRHSVGSVEECRDLPLSPFFLSCLRKEKHPFALWPSWYPPGSTPPCISSSPPRCADEVRLAEPVGGMAGGGDLVEERPPSLSGCKEETAARKVSTIQIRKRVSRPDGGLTPLGLPKRIRLQKDDFSLEEIYTNKNYHTPTEKRKFETIFEEPIVKGGALILTGQRPLRRIMVFKEGGAPRRRKKKGRGGGRTRSCANTSIQAVNIELLLRHKLDQLEAELQLEEAGLYEMLQPNQPQCH